PRCGRPRCDDPVEGGAAVPVRVVIAEDEAIIRLDLKEILEQAGYDVVADTGRGDEALRLVRELQPDLTILDIKMPGMDGLSVAAELASERLSAVLILTAFSQRDLIEQANSAGAMAYLVKPFQAEELVPAIEVAMARFVELRALEEANADLDAQNQLLEDSLETRRQVDRAKGKLMDEHGMKEGEAFSLIQRTAMRNRVSMREVARQVVEGELTPAAQPDPGRGRPGEA
ncbi:MAG: ANTAR domain-containing response regulator, partial [Acidimicrobiales bacterium]